jgi:hypothetical protein
MILWVLTPGVLGIITNISEEFAASIFRVEVYLEIRQKWVDDCFAL